MVQDAGNSLQAATPLTLTAGRSVLRNFIGGSDPNDYYSLTLSGRSRVNTTMDKLKRNANLEVLDAQGNLLQSSTQGGKKPEAIALDLEGGTYYIRSFSNKKNTRYRLQVSVVEASPIPTPNPTPNPTPIPVPNPPVPTPNPTPTPLPNLPNIKLTQAATQFMQPTFVTNAGDGSNRIFVTEKGGKIQILDQATGKPKTTPFLDISDRVSTQVEQGLASVAFPNSYDSNNRSFYVDYSNKAGDIVVSRFQASATNPDVADASSEQILLTIPHRDANNHYGGQLAFDANDYLYISTGDGGVKNDPTNNAQNPKSLLGKILRLDVSGTGDYTIPSSNPFTSSKDPQDAVRDEIWSSGLRNPWRFSIDQTTGNLYIADVGEDSREEINFQAAGNPGGQNYGWNLYEGTLSFPVSSANSTTGLTAPVFEYDHTQGESITGGYVYRGTGISGLQGAYIYGDFVNGNIWGLRQTATGTWQNQLLLDSPYLISTFGQDEQGNLYVTNFYGNGETNGVVYRIDPA
jgi:glucose/arabinose dehydrogenase